MSRYFVTDLPVAVFEFDVTDVLCDTPPNIIWIRAKMDVATDAKVKSELFKLAGDNKTMEAHLGENQLALLVHNIVKWEGPDLGHIPCTPDNIRKLDPTEPHIALVLEAIASRNKRPDGPSPKSATASTSMNAGGLDWIPPEKNENQESLSLQLATGTPRSPLRSALHGHLKKSDA